MKTYQLYTVEHIRQLSVGETISSVVQNVMFGENHDIHTSFELLKKDFVGPLDQYRIKSQVLHTIHGVVHLLQDGERRPHEFNEFLEPVDFFGYHATRDELFIFEAKKSICKGVFRNMRDSLNDLKLIEMNVDYVALRNHELVSNLCAAWFRGVSAKVNAAGVHGSEIQDDLLFKKLSQLGNLSSITIPWIYKEAEYKVMITSNGAIVLVDVRNNTSLELELVHDVYSRLLKYVWQVNHDVRRRIR